ncbi:hypothetical protein A1O7_08135 [Cladophialophora yegresii CBS 114405]|uniref:Uncharacterized protein n=1 Tax=Cladophialophora yegresii CBS 114405 TaxID=1182544 RepID=W9W9H5_9EURO|nr:uncharacterized protein A1O7_08135 [Cladophialophora yegresii CBS 114405]EXJ55209.1 hypothetical protein A1O7_08135 [Cladophialophora yegresii CBS 114405]
MAKNLDSLIEFLVGEIAAQFQGLTINELAKSISAFYADPAEELGSGSASDSTSTNRHVTVDRSLLSKVWLWLGRHPDISLGDNGCYNKSPLAQVESEFPGYIDHSAIGSEPPDEGEPTPRDSRHVSAAIEEQPKIRRPRVTEGPRIRLKEERLYQAICGHPPDPRRVAPLEFELLKYITATRSDGILQGELIRSSGQDKRSVPKRTDALHSKGYIIKEAVFLRGNRTSRLTLKKFAKSATVDADTSQRPGTMLRHVVRRIFDILTSQTLLPQSRLAEELNLKSPAKSAVLQRIVRRLERLKLVKRVRTAVGPSATSGDLQQFVQLLRLAGPEDLENFNNEQLSLDQTLEELTTGADSECLPNAGPAESPAAAGGEESLQPPSKSAVWNPDRLMSNILVEAVQSAGSNGLSNFDARQIITGDFVRRQLESLLHRVSCESLVVQPPHLRHLAIIRHAVTEDGIIRWIHYSWDEFKQHAGETGIDITAIPGAKRAFKSPGQDESDSREDGAADRASGLDEFGFPVQNLLPLQVRGGETTFSSLVLATAAGDVAARRGELVVAKRGAQLALDMRDELPALPHTSDRRSRRGAKSQAPPNPRQTPNRKTFTNENAEVPLGRPRKYMRGTEKFWRMQFKQARLDAGHDEKTVKKGNMRDPVAKALYAARPADFDQTLVKALDAKLPVPLGADEIGEDWITSTRAILNRSMEGVYMSPAGLRWDNFGKRSRVMIVRTPRLASLALVDRSEVHLWQRWPSSASHSFVYRPYHPKKSVKARRPSRPPIKAKHDIEATPGETTEQKTSGPRLGVFHEKPTAAARLPFGIVNPIHHDAQVDLIEISTGAEQGLLQENHNAAERALSPVTVIETVSSEHRQISPGHNESVPDKNSTPEVSIAPKARSIQISPVRSSRKRKLTEKAGQMLESGQTRSMRQSSKTRAMPSEGSTVVQVVDRIDVTDHDPGPWTGIVAAAASPSPSLTAELPEEPAEVQGYTTASGSRARSATPTKISTPRTGKNTNEPGTVEVSQIPAKQKRNSGALGLCRSIVLELVKMTAGAVPNDHITLRRISVARWQEAGEEDRPLLKTIKAAIKSLCELGKLKSVTFNYRGNSTTMVKGSVLFLPSIHPESQLVEGVKQSIKDAHPVDYIPSEWIAEGCRPPLFNKNASSRGRELDDEIQTPTARRFRTPSIDTEERTEERPSKRHRRASSVATNPTLVSVVEALTGNQPKPPLEPTPATAATGFITLKIPSLVSHPAYQLHIWRTTCPVIALLSDVSSWNPWRSKSVQVKTRRKKTGRRGSQLPGKFLLWRNFPSSLDDILQLPGLELDYAQFVSEGLGRNWERFACEVEGVRAWEEQESESAAATRSKYGFINHIIPKALYTEAELPARAEFEALVHFDQDGMELRSAYPPAESWPPFVDALRASPEAASQIAGIDALMLQTMPPPPPPNATQPLRGPRRTSRVPKRKMTEDNDFLASELDAALEPALKRRREAPEASRKTSTANALKRRALSGLASAPRRLTRGERWTQDMAEDRIQRIIVSVVVVRALAGGVEGSIDWSVVMTLFPKSKEVFIRSSWETLSSRRSTNIQALSEEFQCKYIEGLESGKAPSVNLEQLDATDWSAIVEWGLGNLDYSGVKHLAEFTEIELPDTRDDFLDDYGLTFDEPKQYYGFASHPSALPKDGNTRSLVFGVDYTSSTKPTFLHYHPHCEKQLGNNPDLHLAKSWVLSAVLCPSSTFNASLAHAKLSTLSSTPMDCERRLGQALKLLEDAKFVQRVPQRRQVSSPDPSGMRAWEAHPGFLGRFEALGLVSPETLRGAIQFKREILDRAFGVGDVVMPEKHEDLPAAEMFAVLNLMAQGQITARPGPDVPCTRYGLDHERVGYRTRDMDKQALGFGVELRPAKGYVLGDPLVDARGIPIPTGEADGERRPIPPWVDIHGNVNMRLWEIFLAGVMGLVAQMPGISARDASRAFGNALGMGEVEMILAWAEQGGFVKVDEKTRGYQTAGWWWLCIDKAGPAAE